MDRTHLQTRLILLFAYAWISLCMVFAWAAHEVEKRAPGEWFSKWFSRFLVYVGGYGAVLCAISFTSYVKASVL